MNEQHGQDEAFARLRASDPAEGSTLDREALRHDVDRRRAESTTAAPGEPGEDAVVTPIRRRPARWLQVAAAVAGVAVVGSVGFLAGRGSEPTTTAQPAISLAQPGTAEMGAADQSASSADLRMWAPGRVVFTAADGLGDDAGRATSWGLDAAAVYSADQIAAAAAALGVSGDPVQQDGSWTVGAQDGTGPSVSLYSDGSASFNYYDPSRDPWTCDQAAVQDDAAATIDPVSPCQATGTAPSADAATAALRDALTGLGLDPADFQFSTPESYDGPSTYLTAERVIDGQATGLIWSATVVEDGLQSLSGQLAPVIDLGDYDLIGATSAVQRMADPRFGSGYGGVMPLATADGVATTRESSIAAPDPSVPPTLTPGSPIDWPVQQVTITEARLGLSQVTASNGAVILAPAYEFTGDDGSTWSVIAVADSGLSFG